MQLSVIVPLYNCLGLTQAMVASLLSTLPSGLTFEVILVDDLSTDGTRAWLETLASPFRVVLNERNIGFGASNNRGAALAQGDLLALLNNDLILMPGWYEAMAHAHRSLGPKAGIVGNVQVDAQTGSVDHAGIFINYKGKPEHIRTSPSLLSRWIRPTRPIMTVTGACLLLSREAWAELGGFDEGYLNGCEDVDLCLRAIGMGRANAVALRSRVRHHVSRSPGRKARDEANTYRLTLRWKDTLATLGRPDWCRHHFETFFPEPRDFPDPSVARQVFLYLLGLRPTPPEASRDGMQASIALELERWHEMFSRS